MRTIAFVLLSGAGLFAQSPKPQFEVASIKPVALDTSGAPITAGVRIDGAQFRASMMTLRALLAMAYQIRVYQLEAPEWMSSQFFEISATLPDGHSRTDEAREMLQALLAERFHMRMHRETKDFAVFALTVAKGGIQAKEDALDAVDRANAKVEAAGTGSEAGSVTKMPRGATLAIGGNKIVAKKLTMPALADTLARFVDRPVVDQTGLGAEAAYDITLEMTTEDFNAMRVRGAMASGFTVPAQAMKLLETASGDSLHTALAKAGLKLEPRKVPMEMLVIDASDKVPSEN